MWKISFVMLVTTALAGLLIYNPYERSVAPPIDVSASPANEAPASAQVETVPAATVPAAGAPSTIRPQDIEFIVRKVLGVVGALPDKPAATGAPRPLPETSGLGERTAPQSAAQATVVQPGSGRLQEELACERDEKRLARLRASQTRDEVVRFERELGCERLRPQLVRLRESVLAQGEHGGREFNSRLSAQSMTADAQPQTPESETGEEVARSSTSQDQACKRDTETLARLRVSQVRDEVVRFERVLACERLRPQVVRLRESIDAN
jgi:hypothetical protein